MRVRFRETARTMEVRCFGVTFVPYKGLYFLRRLCGYLARFDGINLFAQRQFPSKA